MSEKEQEWTVTLTHPRMPGYEVKLLITVEPPIGDNGNTLNIEVDAPQLKEGYPVPAINFDISLSDNPEQIELLVYGPQEMQTTTFVMPLWLFAPGDPKG